MSTPNNHSHLWNDLSKEERKRLMPFELEVQLRHISSCRAKAVTAHKRHLKELDDWSKNRNRELTKITALGHR